MTAVQAALSGALIGGLYALMAAGLSVTWGTLRVINLAHFGLILVGAYLTYQMSDAWGIDPILTVLVSAPALFAVGAALQWAYDRLNIVEFNSLLVSFGLLMITIEVTTRIWTADFRHLDPAANPYGTSAVHLGPIALPVSRLVALGFALLLIVGGHLVLERTFAGRGLRAFAQDRTVAASFGIDHRRLSLVLGGLAGLSAAVAGMVFALGNTIAPAHAYEWFGTVFAVVILGGIGNLLGALFAGLGVGAFSALVAVLWEPSYEPFVLFLAIIVALVLRPRGLFVRRSGA